MKKNYITLIGLFLLFSVFKTVQPKTIYVDINASGTKDGTTWLNAYTDLALALGNASNGDELWISKGVYKPGKLQSDRFILTKKLTLLGGFSVSNKDTALAQRDPLKHETILSGDINNSNTGNAGDVYTILSIYYSQATVDGLIFEHGYANQSSYTMGRTGAAVSSAGLSTFINCIFRHNTAQGNGTNGVGGAIIHWGDSLTLINCLFHNDIASDRGGAVSAHGGKIKMINCTIAENTAKNGGGVNLLNGNVEAINCLFAKNKGINSNINDNNVPGEASIQNCLLDGSMPAQVIDNGNNIINTSPIFKNSGSQDFSLASNSPGIDKGDNSGIPTKINYALNKYNRITQGTTSTGKILDIGAFEFVLSLNAVNYSQNFDGFNSCTPECGVTCDLPLNSLWYNAKEDNSDWTVDDKGTTSSNTGPSEDHSTGIGKYLYIEASSPCYPNKEAHLHLPALDFKQFNIPQLEFWYHMYGTDMGTLHIDVSTDGGVSWDLDIITPITDNKDEWQELTVNLASYKGDIAIVRLRGITGKGFNSDMAIDDVRISDRLKLDASISRFINPSIPDCFLTDSIFVELTNEGSDTLKTAKLSFKHNGTLQNTMQWNGSLAFRESQSVFVGKKTYAPSDVFEATVELPNGVAETSPTGLANNTQSITISPGLSGTFSVDPSTGDYKTIQAALNDLELKGICSSVVFEISPGIYQEQLTFKSILGASENATITFKAKNNDSANTIVRYFNTTSLNNYVLNFDRAKNYIFDFITLENTNPSYSTVVNFEDDVSNIAFKNCIIKSPPRNSSSTNHALVFAYSVEDVSKLTFNGCQMINGSYSIYLHAKSSRLPISYINISNNYMLNHNYQAVRLSQVSHINLEGNQTMTNSGYTGSIYSLYLYNASGNININRNKIIGEGYAYGIYLSSCEGSLDKRGTISNNWISLGSSSVTRSLNGIYISSSGFFDIWHNNIRIESSSSSSRAVYAGSGGSNRLINNNIVNMGSGHGVNVNSTFVFSEVDFNNTYVPNGNIGYIYSKDVSTFADWVNESGYEDNGFSVNPNYVSNTDLHICNDTLESRAKPVPQVLVDIDGDLRASMRDIGADEFTGSNTVVNLGSDTSICTGGTVKLKVKKNTGDDVLWSTGASSDSISITSTQTLWVKISNASCGALATDTINITKSNINYKDFLSADKSVLCQGETAKLRSSVVADNYTWSSTASNTSSITTSQLGKHVLRIDNACGSGIDSIILLKSDVEYTDFLSSETDKICSNDSVKLVVNRKANSFIWNGFTNTDSVYYTKTDGWNWVEIKDACGAGKDSVFLTSITLPTTDFSFTSSYLTAVFKNNSTNGGDKNTYDWDFGDGNHSSVFEPIHVYGEQGDYKVKLTATNACGSSVDTSRVIVLRTSNAIGMKNKTIHLFPNPNRGTFSIRLSKPMKDAHISIQNINGQNVRNYHFKTLENEVLSFNGSSGIYVVNITNAEMNVLFKITKE